MLPKSVFAAGILTFLLATTAPQPSAKAGPPGPTIVDVAVTVNNITGNFDTLIAALLAADPAVLETLSGNGQHTVFAPTDEAFAAMGLDETNVDTLPQGTLTNILLYHAANGRRDSNDVTSSKQIRMLNRQFTQITVDASGAFIDDAKIVLVDVLAANGIIHVIDEVLMP